jgi:TonB family protein
MHLYALRLLVALLTFGIGVAASSLFDFKRPARFEKYVVVAPPVLVGVAPSEDGPPPTPPRTCNLIVSGGVLNGKAISKPQPAYPPIAKAARASGQVTVQILVDESGRVVSASAVSGHPLLQQAAVAAARQARFSPTLLSGQPVKVSGVITYNFVLE